jgi:hypothetical protein
MPTRTVLRDGLVLTRPRLRQLGYAPDFAERSVEAGSWQRLATGIYLTGDQPPTESQLVEAARAHVGGNFIVTSHVVLRALGLRWLPADDGIAVLVPADCWRGSSGRVRVARCGSFHGIQTWRRHGERFADAARAVIDASRATSSFRDVRGIVLAAVADRWADPEELLGLLESTRRNGSALTRRAIGDAMRGCASPPEAELVDELVGRGVPFYVNPELRLNGLLLGSPDIWLVGTGTGSEVESQERHGDEVAMESTYDRHERITTPGLQLVHLSVGRVRRGVREAADHLLLRARTGPPAPPGLVVVPKGPLLR